MWRGEIGGGLKLIGGQSQSEWSGVEAREESSDGARSNGSHELLLPFPHLFRAVAVVPMVIQRHSSGRVPREP
jgi:hypothetical protein